MHEKALTVDTICYQTKNKPAEGPGETIEELLDNVVVELLVGDVVVESCEPTGLWRQAQARSVHKGREGGGEEALEIK